MGVAQIVEAAQKVLPISGLYGFAREVQSCVKECCF